MLCLTHVALKYTVKTKFNGWLKRSTERCFRVVMSFKTRHINIPNKNDIKLTSTEAEYSKAYCQSISIFHFLKETNLDCQIIRWSSAWKLPGWFIKEFFSVRPSHLHEASFFDKCSSRSVQITPPVSLPSAISAAFSQHSPFCALLNHSSSQN